MRDEEALVVLLATIEEVRQSTDPAARTLMLKRVTEVVKRHPELEEALYDLTQSLGVIPSDSAECLKAEEAFAQARTSGNLELPVDIRQHLGSCVGCATTWETIKEAEADLADLEEVI